MKLTHDWLVKMIKEEIRDIEEGEVGTAITKSEMEKLKVDVPEIEGIIVGLLNTTGDALMAAAEDDKAKAEEYKGYLMTALETWKAG